MIVNCPRCGVTLGEPVDGWAKCPKCGLARPVSGPAAPAKPKKEAEETPKQEGSVTPEAEEGEEGK